jgi:hypothetical protein
VSATVIDDPVKFDDDALLSSSVGCCDRHASSALEANNVAMSALDLCFTSGDATEIARRRKRFDATRDYTMSRTVPWTWARRRRTARRARDRDE